MDIQINPVIFVKIDSFILKQLSLLFISREWLKGNFAQAVDDPVPGKIVFVGTWMKDAGDFSSPPMVSGRFSNNTVGGYLPWWYLFDDSYYF